MLFNNGLDPNKNKLLLRACSFIDVLPQIIALLIFYGADINQTENSETPLSILCKNIDRTFPKVQLLAESGAIVNKKCIDRAGRINQSYANYLRQFMH